MESAGEARVDATLRALIRHLVLSFPQAAILSRSVGTRYHVCVIVPYDGSPEKTVQAEQAMDGERARSVKDVERQLSQLNLPLLLQTRERYDLSLTNRQPHEPACGWHAPEDGRTANRQDGSPANGGWLKVQIPRTVFHGPLPLSDPSLPRPLDHRW
ncbi:MAG: hypothetical protein K0S58_1039 [Nitrospira sp.]|jgi:hypothetical protein|nr:hypothetical protein [Nitrospira sp.]